MARKPSPAQLRARAAFAARFGGRKAKAPRRKSPTPMARRSSRRSFSSRRIGAGVSQASLVDGALTGAAANAGARYIGPQYGPALGMAAVGIYRKNPVAQFLAGVSIGNNLMAGVALPGSTSAAMQPGSVL